MNYLWLLGSTGGVITGLTIEGCSADDYDECEVSRGSTVTGQMMFTASGSAESLECKIFGTILGVELPFPGGCPLVDACSSLVTGDCPIEAGEQIVYNVEMKIENIYPAVSFAKLWRFMKNILIITERIWRFIKLLFQASVLGKWTLIDPSGENFVCFTVPIKIL